MKLQHVAESIALLVVLCVPQMNSHATPMPFPDLLASWRKFIQDSRKPFGIMSSWTQPKLDLRVLVESVRSQMSKPFPTLGLPILDPLELAFVPIDIDHEIGSYHGGVRAVTVSGLSLFEVERIVVNLMDLRAEFAFTLSGLTATGAYTLLGEFARLVHIWGEGNFSVEVSGLTVSGSLQLGKKDEYLHMKSFDVDFNVTRVQTELGGFMGGGHLGSVLSSVIGDIAPTMMNMAKPELLSWINILMLNLVNERLRRLTVRTADVLNWVNNIATDKVIKLFRTQK